MAFNFQEAFQQALQKTMPAKNKSRSASIAWQEAMQNQPKAPTLPVATAAPPSWGQEAFERARAAAQQPAAGQGGWGQSIFEQALAASPQPVTFAQLAAGQGSWGGDAFQRALAGVLSGQVPISQYYPQGGAGQLDFSDWYRDYQRMGGGGGWGGGGGGGWGGGARIPKMDWLRPWEEFRTGQPTTQPYFAEWLESMRPQMQRQYMGQLPPKAEPPRGTIAGETTEGWRQWLQDKLAQNAMYQQWWKHPPEERGMYYGRMAPRMRQMAGI